MKKRMVKRFLSGMTALGFSAFLSGCTPIAIGLHSGYTKNNQIEIAQEKKEILGLEEFIKLEGFKVEHSEMIYCNLKGEYVNRGDESNVIIKWQKKDNWVVSSATRIWKKIEKKRPFAFTIGKKYGENKYSKTIVVLDNGYRNFPEDGKIDDVISGVQPFCTYLPVEISTKNNQILNSKKINNNLFASN